MILGSGNKAILDGVALPLKVCIHNLVVLLDPPLPQDVQVPAAYYQLRLLHQLHLVLGHRNLAMVMHSLAATMLD